MLVRVCVSRGVVWHVGGVCAGTVHAQPFFAAGRGMPAVRAAARRQPSDVRESGFPRGACAGEQQLPARHSLYRVRAFVCAKGYRQPSWSVTGHWVVAVGW